MGSWIGDVYRVIFRYSDFRQTKCPTTNVPCPRLSSIQHHLRNSLIGIQIERKAILKRTRSMLEACQAQQEHVKRMEKALKNGSTPE
jgi:hypothetical protein